MHFDDIVPSDCVCVGSIVDEKNNKIYWFIKREYSATLVIKHGFINYDSSTNTYSSPLDMRFILKFRGKN